MLRSIGLYSSGVACLFVASGCATDVDITERAASTQAAPVGGDTHDVSASTGAPEAARIDMCRMLAWNMSTNQTIAVRNRPGQAFYNVIAVTPAEIYLSEHVVTPGAPDTIDHIVRLEIAALPALASGAAWPQ